jgi:hypothetical protein
MQQGVTGPVEARLSAEDPVVRGYATVLWGERSRHGAVDDRVVRAITSGSGEAATAGKLALLRAIDARPHRRWAPVVAGLCADSDPAVSDQAILTSASVVDAKLVPALITRLTSRRQRDSVREALVAQGAPALDEVARLLWDERTDARLRRHLPRTISRFSEARCHELLFELLTSESDGLVRYKALKGLCHLTVDRELPLDRQALEQQLVRELLELLRMKVVRQLLVESGNASSDLRGQLLLDLLKDKANQALERAFRILQLQHGHSDLRSVMVAVLSDDSSRHAKAVEYLDTLALELEAGSHDMLRVAIDRLDDGERAARARRFLEAAPETAEEALAELEQDDDEALRLTSRHFRAHAPARRADPDSRAG